MAQTVAWVLVIAVLAVAVALCITAIRFRAPAFALLAVIPVAVGLIALAFRTESLAPSYPLPVISGILLAVLATVGGNPITVAVLRYSQSGSRFSDNSEEPGEVKNGTLVDSGRAAASGGQALRGGTIIGYLERLALVAAIVLGRFEIVIVLIAIKGLGRFSELDSPKVRERFIIGTLVSLVWAAGCALLIVL